MVSGRRVVNTELERTNELRQGEGFRRERAIKTNLVPDALEQSPGLVQAT